MMRVRSTIGIILLLWLITNYILKVQKIYSKDFSPFWPLIWGASMMILRSFSWTILLLWLVTKYWWFKRYIFKTLDPFWPLIWRASPFCLISKERSCNFKHFLFYKSSGIPYHFRDILRCNFRGRPHNSLMGSFSKKNEKCIMLGTIF